MAMMRKPCCYLSNNLVLVNRSASSDGCALDPFIYHRQNHDLDWTRYTGSIIASTGAAPMQIRGTELLVMKKLPDGSWKCFRGMGFLA
jgi:hypothetical protein